MIFLSHGRLYFYVKLKFNICGNRKVVARNSVYYLCGVDFYIFGGKNIVDFVLGLVRRECFAAGKKRIRIVQIFVQRRKNRIVRRHVEVPHQNKRQTFALTDAECGRYGVLLLLF